MSRIPATKKKKNPSYYLFSLVLCTPSVKLMSWLVSNTSPRVRGRVIISILQVRRWRAQRGEGTYPKAHSSKWQKCDQTQTPEAAPSESPPAQPPLLVQVEVEKLSFASRGRCALKDKPCFWDSGGQNPCFWAQPHYPCHMIRKYSTLSAHLVPASGGVWGVWKSVQGWKTQPSKEMSSWFTEMEIQWFSHVTRCYRSFLRRESCEKSTRSRHLFLYQIGSYTGEGVEKHAHTLLVGLKVGLTPAEGNLVTSAKIKNTHASNRNTKCIHWKICTRPAPSNIW